MRMAVDNIRRANREAHLEAVPRDFLEADLPVRLMDCEVLFLPTRLSDEAVLEAARCAAMRTWTPRPS